MTYSPPKHIVASTVLVTNDHNEILLVKTHVRGWDTPGGQMENGENPIQAGIRETQEEAGVHIDIQQLRAIYTNITTGIVIFAYVGRYLSGNLSPSEETSEVRWVKRDAVLDLITHPIVYDRTQDLLNHDSRILHRTYTKNPYTIISEVYL